jgi:hypothetical protein
MTFKKARTHNTDNMGKLFPAFSKKAGQVVTVFVPPWRDFVAKLLNFCACTQDKFVMVLAPGHQPSLPSSLRFGGQRKLRLSKRASARNLYPAP